MSIKSAALACAASLFLIGCGGIVREEPSQPFESTKQEILWECDGTDAWIRRWYSDFARTNEVGREDCYCDGTIYMYGSYGNYYSQQGLTYCPAN